MSIPAKSQGHEPDSMFESECQPRAKWDTFRKGESLMMQTKTTKVINDFMKPLGNSGRATRSSRREDQPGDSATALATKQWIRNLIDVIEAMNDYLAMMPAWQWAF
ncbi:hypothetical protein CTA2_7415 [Colletotrichum tanaceti]|uniref:Uncharacterized protein n=1 Tax=Colletotrichum tanaceti TaxID=1306861 RepID=A0A4U6XCG4_9PEZI|nr:hypothetical protein CTA2_7415 [Colletotrichum tanaceti]TKW52792.1 hypothetical protein CTA1_12023 [Colletotrichum tanaceti]